MGPRASVGGALTWPPDGVGDDHNQCAVVTRGASVDAPRMKKRMLVPAIVTVALLVSVGAATHALAGGPRPADVSVTILPSSPDVYVVRRIIYTVLVSDVGGLDASGVTLNATVGGTANAEAFEVTQEQGTCSIPTTGSLACSLGTVPHGSTVKIRLRVRPFLAGTIVVSAKTSAATNADKTNDTTSVSTPARPGNPGSPQLKNEDGPNAAIVIPVTTPPVVTPPVVTPPVVTPPVVTPPVVTPPVVTPPVVAPPVVTPP